MQINSECLPGLPRLAWSAKISNNTLDIDITHGEWVEIQDQFFVEGVWDSPYQEGRFDESPNFFGSGAVIREDSVTFVSSCATTDYLFYQANECHVIVSNSLPFLLSQLGDSLDPLNSEYWNDCETIMEGVNSYQSKIKTRLGSVCRLICRNLIVEIGNCRLMDKPAPKAFSVFNEYVSFLRDAYGSIVSNARDQKRSQSLKILSTQSRGYDSTAVNALAAPFGIDMAFTVSKSKGGGAFVEHDVATEENDDGREIAAKLGFECIAIDRRKFQEGLDDEYLYFAGIANSEDLNFSGLMPFVEYPSILITGTLGELYYPSWYFAQRFPGVEIGTDLRRGDLGGHGLTEVRLKYGFIHLPLIFMGAQHRMAIAKITESEEMRPWRLGSTNYDRPIARRIAEEAGVERSAFGQRKMASTVSFSRPNIPHSMGLRNDFYEFLALNHILPRWKSALFPVVHRINSLIWFASPRSHRWIYYLIRVHFKLTGKTMPLLWSDINSSLFCFSVNRRVSDYSQVSMHGVPVKPRID